VQGPSYQAELLDTLRRKNVEIWFRDTNAGSWPLQLLGSWAPLILLAALWYFMIHQMGRTQKSLKAAASGQNASAQNIDKIG
jgi:ATP-dependent Zn protease